MIQKNSNGSILFIICLASSLVPFMGSALNLALPDINSDLSLNAVMASWVATSYMLSTAIFQIPSARIADMLGRRKIFIWGAIIFALFSILSGLATSGMILIIYRFLSGIGSAMMFGTSMAILTSSVPAEKRGRALGINASIIYLSLAAGPLLGGLLTEVFGWQSIFFVVAAISVVVAIGSVILIKEEWKDDTKGTFDTVGAILYAVGLFSLIYGFSKLPSLLGFVLVVLGVVLFLYFTFYEKKQAQPVFNIHVFLQNRVFRLSSISALINYAATFAISFMLSLYLQYVRGLSPRDAGLILIAQFVVQAFASLKSGKLSDKMSASTLAVWGMLIISLGLIGLCFIGEETSFFLIIVLQVLLGLGFGLFTSPNTNMIMSSVEKKDYSMASATTGTMRLTGQAFSMGIAMMAISLYVGDTVISSSVHAGLVLSMRMTFIICSALCLLGVYTSSVGGKPKKDNI